MSIRGNEAVDRPTDPRPVTRAEVIDHVGSAFGASPVTKGELLAAAEGSGARKQVLEVLERLHSRRFNRPQDLWGDLPEVPVGG